MIIDGLKIANNIKDNIKIKEGTTNKRLGLLYEGVEKNQQSYMKRIKKDFESKIVVDLWDIERTDGVANCMKSASKIKALNNLYDKILAVKPFEDGTRHVLEENLDRNKDIDNYLGFKHGYSCTSEAVQEILKYVNVSIQESNIVVLGSRGEGDDIIRILNNYDNNGTVIGIHSKTPKHLKAKLLSQADIVILATGQKDIYTMEDLEANIARDLCVIDVGRGEIEQRVVDYCKDNPHTHVTTAINGVGVVTTACLLRRVLNNK
ncbi:hypothetical protein K144316041_p20720 (plasmid) [Clostridium tetani]|uniref:hypothetical protein n=1 Tax=Clostridium tetani TaxID=1513 RepID=UPI002953ADBF|nr:hypothetical protein [Clostridium tetani]BDR74233.1 hypothetical protein K144316041_p20720 [Clostridium tetani]